ncbi:hypothetical protein SUDANB150_03748 [Streptomyces sp. enrichment culture]
MTSDARNAGMPTPCIAPADQLFRISPPEAGLYAVGVNWALGDAGAAPEVGRGLRGDFFATAERKSRIHTVLARA